MAALVCLAVTAQADVITNGDFETGDLSGWTVRPTANGQSPTQDVIMYDIDGPGPLGDSLAARFRVGEIQHIPQWEGIELVQDVSLAGGTPYAFDADVSAWNNQSGGNFDGGRFELILDGGVLDMWNAGFINPGERLYGHVSATYTPGASGTYEIGLRITRPWTPPSGIYQLVDNFTGIPEPATLTLLALGGLAALRRR